MSHYLNFLKNMLTLASCTPLNASILNPNYEIDSFQMKWRGSLSLMVYWQANSNQQIRLTRKTQAQRKQNSKYKHILLVSAFTNLSSTVLDDH